MATDNIFKIPYGYKKRFLALREETKDDIFRRFNAGESLTKISIDVCTHRQVIATAVREKGGDTNRNNQRILSLNDDAFSVITPECAYWIGFLMADGCVHADSNCIGIGLQKADYEHLEKFKRFVGSSHKIGFSEAQVTMIKGQGLINGTGVCRFQIRSTKMVNDLDKYGIIPRKAHIAKAVPDLEMNRDFWRGMVDGDGSLSETIDLVNSKKPFLVTSLNGTKDICQQFINFVNNFYPTQATPYFTKGTTHKIAFSKKIGFYVAKALYEDCCVSLDRKYQRYVDYMIRYSHYLQNS